jgi:hypothetical protein
MISLRQIVLADQISRYIGDVDGISAASMLSNTPTASGNSIEGYR